MMLSTFLSFEADGQQKSETKFNMSYVYFGNSSSYNDYVDNTKNSLDEISPNYFIIDQSGNLSLTSALNKKFIKTCINVEYG